MKAAANKRLLEVLEILQNGLCEYAFRTLKEVVAYLKISRELAADKAAWEAGKWKSDLHDEILQKILPRLHVSLIRVGPLRSTLGWYLHSGDKEGAMKFFPALGEELPEKPVQEIIALHKAAAAFPQQLRQSATHGPRGQRGAIRELHLLTRPAGKSPPALTNLRINPPQHPLSTPKIYSG